MKCILMFQDITCKNQIKVFNYNTNSFYCHIYVYVLVLLFISIFITIFMCMFWYYFFTSPNMCMFWFYFFTSPNLCMFWFYFFTSPNMYVLVLLCCIFFGNESNRDSVKGDSLRSPRLVKCLRKGHWSCFTKASTRHLKAF